MGREGRLEDSSMVGQRKREKHLPGILLNHLCRGRSCVPEKRRQRLGQCTHCRPHVLATHRGAQAI